MAATHNLPNLNQHFIAFAKLGDIKSDGRTISYAQAQKWLQQAKVIGTKMSAAQAADLFNKFRTPALNFNDFMAYVDDVAISMRMTSEELKKMLAQVNISSEMNRLHNRRHCRTLLSNKPLHSLLI